MDGPPGFSNINFHSPFLTPAAPSDAQTSDSDSSSFAVGSSSSSAAAAPAPVPVSSAAYDAYSDMFPSLPTSTRPPQQTFTPAPVSFSSKIRDHTERFQIEPPQLRPSGLGDKSHPEIIKSIIAETGTKIECSTAKNGTMTVLITGKIEKTGIAKKKLLAGLSKQYEIKVEVPREHLSSLIGKQGSKLKSLQEKTGAKINTPKSDDPSEHVIVSGDKASVELARAEILEFLKEKVPHSDILLFIFLHHFLISFLLSFLLPVFLLSFQFHF